MTHNRTPRNNPTAGMLFGVSLRLDLAIRSAGSSSVAYHRQTQVAAEGSLVSQARTVRLTAHDAGACVALEIAAFDPTERFPASVWRRFLGPCQDAGTALALGIRAPRGVVAAAVIALVRRNTTMVRIYTLAVDPGWRRHGYGSMLIESIARRTRGDLSLEVRMDNAPARALYERLGFLAGESLPDYYVDGAPGIRYRRFRLQKKSIS